MGPLLTFVDSVASASSANLQDILWRSPSDGTVELELLAHGKAFDQGLITSQRLLDVAVAPFFKLGLKAIQLQGSSLEGILDDLAMAWAGLSCTVLSGEVVAKEQGAYRFYRVLQPSKRDELVKAFVKAKLAEVHFIQSQTSETVAHDETIGVHKATNKEFLCSNSPVEWLLCIPIVHVPCQAHKSNNITAVYLFQKGAKT